MKPFLLFRIGAFCFLVGIATGLLFSYSIAWAFLFVSILFSCAFVFFPKNIFLCVVFSLIFFGAWYYATWRASSWKELSENGGVLKRAEVVRDITRTENLKQATLLPIDCGSSPCPSTYVLGIFPSFSDISSGDILSLSCHLERPKRFSPDFDYPMVLAKDGIGFLCQFPKEWKKDGHSDHFFSSSLRLSRGWFENGLYRALPEPEAGFVAGVLIGGNDRLSKDVQMNFSRMGLSHIVAVSGYNISLVIVLLMNMFVVIGLYRQRAFWGALFGIILFTVLVGAPASAVRAALMGGTALFATRIGRMGSPVNAILFAGCCMLLFNPLLLRYDIGFQLSFMATLGIFLFVPLAFFSIRLGDILSTTIAAELFVLPIILFHFHMAPILSLLSNVLILPFVPMVMLFGFFSGIIGAIFPAYAVIFNFPAFFISHAILLLVEYLASWKYASVTVNGFGAGALLVWYVILFAILFVFQKKKILGTGL